MCKFMSVNSNGKGDVKFFKVEDIAKIMAEGNKENYNWNSHTSIAHYYGHDEDRWNKWEYDPYKKELVADSLVTENDKAVVKEAIEEYLKNKDVGYLRNLYNMNSGDWNSGNMNSGNRNSGDMNSGNMNSGYRNSGDRNSGNMNSGNMNSGYRNSGNMNSGDRNSGNMNSGNMNSGDRNSGDMNSGNMNSGDMNSGNRNSGYMNSGALFNSLCSKKMFFLFNKPCTEKEYMKLYDINMSWFVLTEWIYWINMTAEEKDKHPQANITGGYLKTHDYKEAWSKCPKEVLEQIKKLKNFDARVFKEITGIDIKRRGDE